MSETRYYYDGSLLLAEKDSAGKIQKIYINDGEGIIGMVRYIYSESGVFSHHQRMYYLYDSLGSVSAVADENGMPLQEYYYTPYGSISNVQRDTVNSLRFIGRYGGYKDDDSGLVYFWHRWYDERDGRWISRDPVNAGLNINLYPYSDTTGKFLLDLNLYRYAFNDPTFWIDSSGLCPDRGCTERRNCDKTDSNDDLGNCLKNAKDNYLKGLAIYFGATAPFHEAVVIGCWATGPGFAACMASVNLILEIPDLIAIGALTTGYLQIRQQCFDLYGCKGK